MLCYCFVPDNPLYSFGLGIFFDSYASLRLGVGCRWAFMGSGDLDNIWLTMIN
jgi:hypothetical protein